MVPDTASLMRLARFLYNNKEYWGIVQSGCLCVLKTPPFKRIIRTKRIIPLEAVKLLAPSIPSKIILVGLNYIEHAKELNMPLPQEPVIFLKPPSSLIAHEDKIIYPKNATRVDYEAELALVIKKEARNIKEKEVKDHILGFTCLNDVTERNLQKKDIQWTRAKSFDTFCPCGPWLETNLDYSCLNIKSYLNFKLKQSSSTKNLIFSVERLVSFISNIMTLLPGDIISTGTPAGIGPMLPGDTVKVEIEGIGCLENKVV